MKKHYFVLVVLIGILCTPALGKESLGVESHDAPLLIAEPNPMLTGIKQLCVVIESSGVDPNKDGLVWDELEANIKRDLKKAGIRIAPDIQFRREARFPNLSEFRVYVDMLELIPG